MTSGRAHDVGSSTSERLIAAIRDQDNDLARMHGKACANEWCAVHEVNGLFVDRLLHHEIERISPAMRWTQTAADMGAELVRSLAGRPVVYDDLSSLADELVTRTRASLSDALDVADSGEIADAVAIVRSTRDEYVERHDAWIILIQAIMRRLNIEHGVTAVRSALTDIGRALMGARVPRLPYEAERLLEMHARGMRGHPCDERATGSFGVEETDEAFEMIFSPCGSGGRLRRFAVGEQSWLLDAYGRTHDPSDWTAGYTNVPLYCTHCFVFHEVVGVELTGLPLRHTMFDPDPNAPCRWVVYKDPAQVPVDVRGRCSSTEVLTP